MSNLDNDLIQRMEDSTIGGDDEQQSVLDVDDLDSPCELNPSLFHIELNGVEKSRGGYSTLQCNTAITRDFTHTIPHPVVVTVHVEGQPARALIDTSSLADFMSLTLAEQLHVKRLPLEKPLTTQLAVQGSRSKVNFRARVHFQYQGADYDQYFDVINLQSYDLILGTPFLFQHQVLVGLNSPRVILGSKMPLAMKGPQVSVLKS